MPETIPTCEVILPEFLVDGTGADPISGAAVVVRDGRVTAVTDRAGLGRTAAEGARVTEYPGCTLLPGLIDTHVHLCLPAGPTHDYARRLVTEESDYRLALRSLANAQAHLRSGVTTIRDVGGRGFVALSVRDAIREGLALGPRMQASGPPITTPTGHLNFWNAIARNEAEVRQRATEIMDAGADLIKLCATGGIMTAESDPMASQYTVEELRAAVEVAEARGTLVAAHVLASEGLLRCVEAGVRSIEHCLWQDTPGVFQFRPDVAAVMREKRIFAGLTFAGISQTRYLQQKRGIQPPDDWGAWLQLLQKRYAADRELIASGVRYVLHSDAGVRETPFGRFWLILAAGAFELELSPVEAIRAVTATPAELMGLHEEVGQVAPGLRADLLLVRGNAGEDLEAVSHPQVVWLEGRRVAEQGILYSSVTGSIG
ncbi:MAG: amidohydrolase family protein [Armatimonadetes bacterium]|nr:amidohydrolase family protein [Armatimonadota bacterium]